MASVCVCAARVFLKITFDKGPYLTELAQKADKAGRWDEEATLQVSEIELKGREWRGGGRGPVTNCYKKDFLRSWDQER